MQYLVEILKISIKVLIYWISLTKHDIIIECENPYNTINYST